MSRFIRPFCVIFLLTLASAAQQAGANKRIAILGFTPSSDGVADGAGTMVADALEQRLVQDGKYSLMERSAVDNAMAEPDSANKDQNQADAATAAKLGKILGVEAVIFGSVAECSVQTEMVDMSTVGQRPEAKSTCSITAMIVDTSSSEILASFSGHGETKKKVYFSNMDPVAILTAAISDAVDDVCTQMNAAPKLAPLRTEVAEATGQVADVNGDTIIVTIGGNAGLQVGQTLEIRRKGRQITDPATNEVIKTITEKIGEATVTEVDTKSATAKFTGNSSPRRGDTVKVEQ